MKLSRRSLNLLLTALVVLFVSVFLFTQVVHAQGVVVARSLSVNKQIIAKQSNELEEKSTVLKSASSEIRKLETEKKSLKRKLSEEKQKIQVLKQQIAARRAKVVRKPIQPRSQAPSAGGGARSNCGDNQYAAYIYGQESGGRVTGMCDTSAVNPRGCRGIGQACPGSKLPCGANYACQNAWFTNYAIERYTSWAAAYNFHKSHGWW